MNKQQLASKIWQSANNMRSKIEANEYKDYILGFIFYKFLSEIEEEVYFKEGGTKDDIKDYLVESDAKTVEHFQQKIGYFIDYKNLFSTWLNDKNFNVSNVSDALNAFNRLIAKDYKKVYEKIFDTLQAGLNKLGDSSGAQTKAIVGLLNLIKDIPMDDKQGYDVLGFIYEYLISMFAANAGKKAGEFYTPHEVSVLMSQIVAHHLKNRDTIDIYDPTSGSGSLLINIGKAVAKYMKDKDRIKYFAQELKENTFSLTRMNLVMRGIRPSNIIARCGDTLSSDWPYFDDNDRESTYHPLFVDAVVSNPPYSQKWDPSDMDNDARFKDYGLAPKSKADYAFLLHDLYHLRTDGVMTIVLPHGVLFRGGEEEKIRTNLIEKNNIDAIIGLPANIFFGTGIPTIIMVLKKSKNDSNVLIIDASKGFEKVGKNNKLRSSDIKRIVDTYISRTSIPGYSKLVTRDEIKDNGYNLNIPRYVDSSEKPEVWDIYSNIYGGIPLNEVDELSDYWSAFPSLKEELFKPISAHSMELRTENIDSTIINNKDVKKYKDEFNNKFSDFYPYLKKTLIDNLASLDPAREEDSISNNIFARLSSIPLIDKYSAYQLLDDEWNKISIDLEIIKTEGEKSITQVDPNLVIKKKDGKDSEVQDGYIGHILPFKLVQEEYFSDTLALIRDKENRTESIDSDISEQFENVPEDYKDQDCIDNEKSEFVPKVIAQEAKKLKKQKTEDYSDFDKIILKVNELLAEKKSVSKGLKVINDKLVTETKTKIESLNTSEALKLLEHKWISPIVNSINLLPDLVLKQLIAKVNKLSKKYDYTLVGLDDEIAKTEKELSSMIDELNADEFDSKGLEEFKKLLGGDK